MARPSTLLGIMYRFLCLALWAAVWGGMVQPQTATATHIVGGEFTLVRQPIAGSPDNHRLELRLYFDNINGSQGALDSDVQVYIFRKGAPQNSALVRSIVMRRVPDFELVNYRRDECGDFTSGVIETRVLRYNTDLVLTPQEFSNPDGYYVVWERCCRNAAITNIFEPGSVGQTFYLEFPPVRNDFGIPQVNSSPTGFLPIREYGCIGKPFSVDFSGTDPDGDQLRYRIVAPLAGNSTPNMPGQHPSSVPPFVAPYAQVRFRAPYSIIRQMGSAGAPLSIDSVTGRLTMIPDRVGLFVFAVEVAERRNGRTIGVLRREFQILVRDCPPNPPPQLSLRPPVVGGRTLRSGDTLRMITRGVDTCLTLLVTDTLPDFVTLSVVAPTPANGLRFGPGNLTVSPSSGPTTPTEPLVARLCLSRCTGFPGQESGWIALAAEDAACPLPSYDTLRLYLDLIPRPVPPPQVRVSAPNRDGDTLCIFPPGVLSARLEVFDSTRATSLSTSLLTITPPLPAGSNVAIRRQPATGNATDTTFFEVATALACGADPSTIYQLRLTAARQECLATLRDTTFLYVRACPRDIPLMSLELADSAGQILTASGTGGGPTPPVISLHPGERARLRVRATSTDTTRPATVIYLGQQGLGSASGDYRRLVTDANGEQGELVINASCALAGPAGSPLLYRLRLFGLVEDCPPNQVDSLVVTIAIEDRPPGPEVLPNIVTLAPDGLNDCLTFDPSEGLVQDNCQGIYDGVRIYNRWGRQVYQTDQRAFCWRDTRLPPGTYYYHVALGGRTRRGWVEVVQ